MISVKTNTFGLICLIFTNHVLSFLNFCLSPLHFSEFCPILLSVVLNLVYYQFHLSLFSLSHCYPAFSHCPFVNCVFKFTTFLSLLPDCNVFTNLKPSSDYHCSLPAFLSRFLYPSFCFLDFSFFRLFSWLFVNDLGPNSLQSLQCAACSPCRTSSVQSDPSLLIATTLPLWLQHWPSYGVSDVTDLFSWKECLLCYKTQITITNYEITK